MFNVTPNIVPKEPSKVYKGLPLYTQQNTGPYSRFNCGPACVTSFSVFVNDETAGESDSGCKVKDTRDNTRSWTLWNALQITDNLIEANVYHRVSPDVTPAHMKEEFNGSSTAAILNPNMYSIPSSEKPYKTWHPFWGHYVILVEITQNAMGDDRWVIYDPYDNSITHYKPETMSDACMGHWNKAILI